MRVVLVTYWYKTKKEKPFDFPFQWFRRDWRSRFALLRLSRTKPWRSKQKHCWTVGLTSLRSATASLRSSFPWSPRKRGRKHCWWRDWRSRFALLRLSLGILGNVQQESRTLYGSFYYKNNYLWASSHSCSYNKSHSCEWLSCCALRSWFRRDSNPRPTA